MRAELDEHDQFPVSAKMWYSGSGVMIVSLAAIFARCHHALACSTFATMLRCVSIAPLATPVVPPVYCRNAMSSCVSRRLERREPALFEHVVEAQRARQLVLRHLLAHVRTTRFTTEASASRAGRRRR